MSDKNKIIDLQAVKDYNEFEESLKIESESIREKDKEFLYNFGLIEGQIASLGTIIQVHLFGSDVPMDERKEIINKCMSYVNECDPLKNMLLNKGNEILDGYKEYVDNIVNNGIQ